MESLYHGGEAREDCGAYRGSVCVWLYICCYSSVSDTTEEKRPSISTLKEHLFFITHIDNKKNTSELREVRRGGKEKRRAKKRRGQ